MQALEKSLDDVGVKKMLYESKLGIILVPVRVIEQAVGVQESEIAQLPRKKYFGESESDSSLSSSRYAAKNNGTSDGFGEIVYSAYSQVEYIVTSK